MLPDEPGAEGLRIEFDGVDPFDLFFDSEMGTIRVVLSYRETVKSQFHPYGPAVVVDSDEDGGLIAVEIAI